MRTLFVVVCSLILSSNVAFAEFTYRTKLFRDFGDWFVIYTIGKYYTTCFISKKHGDISFDIWNSNAEMIVKVPGFSSKNGENGKGIVSIHFNSQFDTWVEIPDVPWLLIGDGQFLMFKFTERSIAVLLLADKISVKIGDNQIWNYTSGVRKEIVEAFDECRLKIER